MLLHYPKTNGAVMAQNNLLHHWKNPTHGDGAKPRAITPVCSGACNGADTPISRYAPAALCLRRRSQAHRSDRWQYGLAGCRRGHWIALVVPSLTRISWSQALAVVSRCLPGSAARVRDSFLRSVRANTAARVIAHQWTRQGLCGPCSNALAITAFADTVQTRPQATCRRAHIAAICSTRPRDDKSWERVFACGLPHSKSFLGSNGAHQALGLLAIPGMLARSGRNRPPNFQIDPRTPDFLGRPIIDHTVPYTAAVSPITRDAMQCILTGIR